VARHAAGHPQELERHRRLPRAHGEVVADREDGHLRSVDAADQLHVAEDVGVAGEVEGRTVLEGDDEPRWLA